MHNGILTLLSHVALERAKKPPPDPDTEWPARRTGHGWSRYRYVKNPFRAAVEEVLIMRPVRENINHRLASDEETMKRRDECLQPERLGGSFKGSACHRGPVLRR